MNNIPRWLLDERHKTCATCNLMKTCEAKYEILNSNPPCPLKKLKGYNEALAERAWPSSAPRASGCCDSARNYVTHSHVVQKTVDRAK